MSRITLADIVVDAGTQIRAAIDESVVSQYAERMTEGDVFPAVIVFHDGNQYYLADGFHRALASQRNDFRDIEADVRPGTRSDALWFALGANKANGQRLTEVDKKHAVKLAFSAFPDMSNNRIAEQLGCSQSYVQRLKSNEVPTGGNVIQRVTGKDGKSYPASRVRADRGLSVGVDKSKAAVAQRKQDIREMAERGFSTRQIAAAIGIGHQSISDIATKEQIVIHADRVVGKTKRHDPNRIIDRMVMDAENLTADVGLIDFTEIDRERLPEWLKSIKASRDQLGAFIRRLMKEQQNNVEAA